MRSFCQGVLALSLCVLLLGATDARGTMVERSGAFNSRDYARFAGAPVKSIRFASLHGFMPLNREQVVLFTRAREAWLLDLAGPCRQVQTAFAVSVSNFGQRIYSGFDSLRVGRQQCRITRIRGIDLEAHRAAAGRTADKPPVPASI